MKSLLKAFSAVALLGTLALPVFADDTTTTTSTTTDSKDQKDLKKVIEDQGINYVETAQKGITLSGYVDTSYTESFGGRGTAFGAGQSELHQFDVNNNNFNINAVKIALEKALPDKNEWAAGFRLDTIYGHDATILNNSDPALSPADTLSGTSTNDFYLEQALVKFRIPVGNGLDIYMGKFVTFLGYEVIESPANLNFSRGLLFTNAIPLTHTGIYADYKFNDMFEAKLGIVDGWNTSVSPPNGSTTTFFGGSGTTDSQNTYPFGGKAITGQLTINAPGKNANITQSFIYSPSGEPSNGEAGFASPDNGPVVVYDIWGNWNPTFVKDSALLLGFNVDFGYNGSSGEPANAIQPLGTGSNAFPVGAVTDSTTWYGVALYAQYKFNKVFSLAGRGEYLHEDPSDNPKFGADPNPLLSQDDWSATLTASFNLWDNLLTRVEYRADVLGSNSTPQADSRVQNEVTFNAVYSF